MSISPYTRVRIVLCALGNGAFETAQNLYPYALLVALRRCCCLVLCIVLYYFGIRYLLLCFASSFCFCLSLICSVSISDSLPNPFCGDRLFVLQLDETAKLVAEPFQTSNFVPLSRGCLVAAWTSLQSGKDNTF